MLLMAFWLWIGSDIQSGLYRYEYNYQFQCACVCVVCIYTYIHILLRPQNTAKHPTALLLSAIWGQEMGN